MPDGSTTVLRPYFPAGIALAAGVTTVGVNHHNVSLEEYSGCWRKNKVGVIGCERGEYNKRDWLIDILRPEKINVKGFPATWHTR